MPRAQGRPLACMRSFLRGLSLSSTKRPISTKSRNAKMNTKGSSSPRVSLKNTDLQSSLCFRKQPTVSTLSCPGGKPVHVYTDKWAKFAWLLKRTCHECAPHSCHRGAGIDLLTQSPDTFAPASTFEYLHYLIRALSGLKVQCSAFYVLSWFLKSALPNPGAEQSPCPCPFAKFSLLANAWQRMSWYGPIQCSLDRQNSSCWQSTCQETNANFFSADIFHQCHPGTARHPLCLQI